MSSFQPFVQTDVTHITVEGAVFEDVKKALGDSCEQFEGFSQPFPNYLVETDPKIVGGG